MTRGDPRGPTGPTVDPRANLSKTPDSNKAYFIGRGGRIRTGGPLRPRQVRYQAALRPDATIIPRPPVYHGSDAVRAHRGTAPAAGYSRGAARRPAESRRAARPRRVLR